MKKLWTKWTEIALVKRILVGLILGAILGIAVPGASAVSILGDVFVGALKAIAPLLVFFLVISSLCNAGKSHGGVIKTVIILYMFSTVLAAVIAVFASMIFPVELTLTTAAYRDCCTTGYRRSPQQPSAERRCKPCFFSRKCKLCWNPDVGCPDRTCFDVLPNNMTKNVLAHVANGLSTAVTRIINMAPFGIFGLVFNTVSTVSDCRYLYLLYGKLLLLLVGSMLFIYFVTNPILVLLVHPQESLSADLPMPEEKRASPHSSPEVPPPTSLINMESLRGNGTWTEDTYSVTIPLRCNDQYGWCSDHHHRYDTGHCLYTLVFHVDIPTAIILSLLAALSACGASGVAGGSLLLIPMACSLFGISE